MEGVPKNESAQAPVSGRVRYVFANVEFDEWLGRLRVDGELVEVEPRPLRLLAELLRRVNEVLTKEELLDAVWQGRPTVDHVLANAVSKLRTALGLAGAGRLATLPRVGYRFSGPVQRLPAGGIDSAFESGQTLIGRDGFVLDRLLGQGGNSDVWLARHAKLGQSHVFKLATDGPRLAALKREFTLYRLLGQTLGPRPDIARILDANFQTAPFFLECEYGGRSLLEWADDGNTLLELSQTERLDISLQVARAVAAAHSVGVLHKDLKPGNVLIDGQRGAWVVKLTDFGSGRLLEPERLAELRLTALGITQAADTGASSSRSATGSTLMYVAPELLAGQAPTLQSDVYSLGVMLFQLLVGDLRRPLLTGWQRDVSDELLCVDITAATESEPTQRLSSVAALIERLATIEARHESIRAQDELQASTLLAAASLQSARARRPWVLALIGVLVIALLVSIVLGRQAVNSAREAARATAQADAINQFMSVDVLAAPDFALMGGSTPTTLHQLLRRGTVAAGDRFKGQPNTEAAVRSHLARTLHRMSSPTEASVEYTKAISLLSGLLPAHAPELLRLKYESALVSFEMGEEAEATKLLRETQALTRASDLETDHELSFAAARVMAWAQLKERDFNRATSAAQSLVDIADRHFADRLDYRLEARRTLATALVMGGDDTGAERVVTEMQQPALNRDGVGALVASRVSLWRAMKARDGQRFAEAEQLLLSTLTQLMQSPKPSQWHIANAHSDLGHVYTAAGQNTKAVERYATAIPLFIQVLGADHQFVKITEVNLAARENALGLHAQALARGLANDAWFKANATNGRYGAQDRAVATSLLGLGRPAEALLRLQAIYVPPAGEPATSANLWGWENQWLKAAALTGAGRKAEGRQLADLVRAALAGTGLVLTDQPEATRYLGPF